MLFQHKDSMWQLQNTPASNNSRRVGKTQSAVAKIMSAKAVSGSSFGLRCQPDGEEVLVSPVPSQAASIEFR